jgi:replicative DNA helicase
MSTTSSPGAVDVPYSEQAEVSVVGQMLARPKVIGEVSATLLQGSDFLVAAHHVLYDHMVESFYADDPIDPLTVAEGCMKRLERLWGVQHDEVVRRVRDMAAVGAAGLGEAPEHALVVKRYSDLRSLLDLSAAIRVAVEREELSPDQIAGMASSEAMKIATDSSSEKHELVHFSDAGRRFIHEMKTRMALRDQGVNIGVRFGISAIDSFTSGLQPTELLIGGGEAGVGKSAVWWKAAMNYAESEARKAPDQQRIGTLVFSLEMGETPSSMRWAQGLTAIESTHMRSGALRQDELRKIVEEWGRKKHYPLWMNYSAGLSLSQIRAIVAEGIRKHNIGLVVIDHFLLLTPDTPGLKANEADDERVKFLKQQIAMDLDVAVVCLAHTRKDIERADKRPRMGDLRGSGMIAAFADYVMLMYRPWRYATEKEQSSERVAITDAEMLHVKNRHGAEGVGNFYIDLAKMLVV